jgi:hypothetical protein
MRERMGPMISSTGFLSNEVRNCGRLGSGDPHSRGVAKAAHEEPRRCQTRTSFRSGEPWVRTDDITRRPSLFCSIMIALSRIGEYNI